MVTQQGVSPSCGGQYACLCACVWHISFEIYARTTLSNIAPALRTRAAAHNPESVCVCVLNRQNIRYICFHRAPFGREESLRASQRSAFVCSCLCVCFPDDDDDVLHIRVISSSLSQRV